MTDMAAHSNVGRYWTEGIDLIALAFFSFHYTGFADGVVNCKTTQLGTEFAGDIAVTIDNRQCQRWDSQSPHAHTRNNPATFPDSDVSAAENYCRNPDNEPGGPWCYTTDPNIRWQYCGVPFCSTTAASGEPEYYSSRRLDSPSTTQSEITSKFSTLPGIPSAGQPVTFDLQSETTTETRVKSSISSSKVSTDTDPAQHGLTSMTREPVSSPHGMTSTEREPVSSSHGMASTEREPVSSSHDSSTRKFLYQIYTDPNTDHPTTTMAGEDTQLGDKMMKIHQRSCSSCKKYRMRP